MSGRLPRYAYGLLSSTRMSWCESLYYDALDLWDQCTAEAVQEWIVYFLDSFRFSISYSEIMLLLTLFALFGRDIETMASLQKHDGIFNALYTLCFASFLFELVGNILGRTKVIFSPSLKIEGYLFSFNCALDVIALFSLFSDVRWIADPMGLGQINSSFSGSANFIKAGRVVRLVRLVRLMRLFRHAQEKAKRRREEAELLELVQYGLLSIEDVEKQRALNDTRTSRLGAELSEAITQKVILIVLVMIIILPLVTYSSSDNSSHFATHTLQTFNVNDSVSQQSKALLLQTVLNATDSQSNPNHYLLSLRVAPSLCERDEYVYHSYARLADTPNQLEDTYNLTAIVTQSLNYTTLSHNTHTPFLSTLAAGDGSAVVYETSAIFSFRNLVVLDASYSVGLTIFVGFLLVVGAAVFTADAEKLVLKPIERMMNMVDAVAANPLAPLSLSHHDHESELGDESGRRGPKKEMEGDYETKLLESTIDKVTGLLRVGFGEAGAGIISANLSTNNKSSIIDPLLPGVRVYAIFGFCDIHHFEDINRRLGNDVLTFVNTIAEIVHRNVHNWGGQCNKNLGNAFVVVWRIGDEQQLMAANSASILSRKGNAAARALPQPPTPGANRNSVDGESTDRNSTASPSTRSRKMMPRVSFSNMSSSSSAVDDADNEDGASQSGGSQQRKFTVDLRRVPGIEEIAESALLGYLKVIADINRQPSVLRYRYDARLNSEEQNGMDRNSPLPITPRDTHKDADASARSTRSSLAKLFPVITESPMPSSPPSPVPSERSGSVTPTRSLSISHTRAESELRGVRPTGVRPASVRLEREREREKLRASQRVSMRDVSALREEMALRESEGEHFVSLAPDAHTNVQTASQKESSSHTHAHKEQFKVRMGFGLHAGWAIEGAVGSLFKVDATYLSPHVNLAARLETACKQYALPILFSHAFQELLSPAVQLRCRQVDCVTVKGSEVPIGVYTYDCWQEQWFSREKEREGERLTNKALLKMMASMSERDRESGGSRPRVSLLGSLSPSLYVPPPPASPSLCETPGGERDKERRKRATSTGSLSEILRGTLSPSPANNNNNNNNNSFSAIAHNESSHSLGNGTNNNNNSNGSVGARSPSPSVLLGNSGNHSNNSNSDNHNGNYGVRGNGEVPFVDNPYRRMSSGQNSVLSQTQTPTQSMRKEKERERDGSVDEREREGESERDGEVALSLPVSAKKTSSPPSLSVPLSISVPIPLALPQTAGNTRTRALLSRVHQELMRAQQMQEEERERERVSNDRSMHNMSNYPLNGNANSSDGGVGLKNTEGALTEQEKEQEERDYMRALALLRQRFGFDCEPLSPPQEDLTRCFAKDLDLLQLRMHCEQGRFRALFAEAMKEYLQGRWPTAKPLFEQANRAMAQASLAMIDSALFRETDVAKRERLRRIVEEIKRESLAAAASNSASAGNSNNNNNNSSSTKSNGNTTNDEDRLSVASSPSLSSSSSSSPSVLFSALSEEALRTFGDGPCQTLLAYINNCGGVAPADWQGFRPLTSK